MLYILRINRVFGPFIKVFIHMGRDICKFLLILLIIHITFACFGHIVFLVPQFSTFPESLMTIYSWMLGSFDLNEMRSEGLLGILFMSFYLFLNIILLLNLLIAILSSTYSKLEGKGIGLYLRNIIEILPQWRTQPSWNALTFRVPFFNLLNLCCFHCLYKRNTKLNYCLEIVNYIPAFLILLPFFLVLDCIMFPFTWFAILRRAYQQKSCYFSVLSLLCFPIISVFLIICDIVLISFQLWRKPHEKLAKPSCRHAYLSEKELDLLCKIFSR